MSPVHTKGRGQPGGVWGQGWSQECDVQRTGREAEDLVDVRDEPALTGRVDLLVVGPQLALDGEEQDFQVPFLGEPEAGGQIRAKSKATRSIGTFYVSK